MQFEDSRINKKLYIKVGRIHPRWILGMSVTNPKAWNLSSYVYLRKAILKAKKCLIVHIRGLSEVLYYDALIRWFPKR